MFCYASLVVTVLLAATAVHAELGGLRLKDSRVVHEVSGYPVLLRESGPKTKGDVFYGFFESREGASHMYQFNSMQSLQSGRAEGVWMFRQGNRCVPNSAVVYNEVLYCRLFTSSKDEFRGREGFIAPVTIAAFSLAAVPTKMSAEEPCKAKAAAAPSYPISTEANITVQSSIFDRIPFFTRSAHYIDQFDVMLPSASKTERPNMVVRFHADSTGLWLTTPHQPRRSYTPYMQRFRVDAKSLATSQDEFPKNKTWASDNWMMALGIGAMVDGYYNGLIRGSDGSIYFRQRHMVKKEAVNERIVSDLGPFNAARDGPFVLLPNAEPNVYISFVQYHPGTQEFMVTYRDLSKPLGSQFKHVIVPITIKK